ncbi:MAG TPA: signal peptidase II [Povalibacter sp.]|nr:signal peptidase II [Povalibacter sp.]
MTITKRILLICAVLVCSVGCDQVTKSAAKAWLPRAEVWSYFGDTVRLQLTGNSGAFLSLGDSLPEGWRRGILSIGVGGILFGLLAYLLRKKPLDARTVLPLSLVIGGGISNLIDRVLYDGYVVDFINVGIGPLRTGIFNIADVAISTGVVWLLLGELRGKPDKQP